MPKKTVRAETLKALLAEWEERQRFCLNERYKFARATHGRREWEARASAIGRCFEELNAKLQTHP